MTHAQVGPTPRSMPRCRPACPANACADPHADAIADVIIIGAGIVGAACAHAFSAAGLRVLVVEQALVGGGATAAAMGHIVAMDDSPAQWALTRYARQLWHALQPQLPSACEYRHTGTLWVAADDEEMAEVERKHRFLTENEALSDALANPPSPASSTATSTVPSNTATTATSPRAQVLSATRLRALEPHLRPTLAGALFVPSDAVLYPPAAAEALLALAEARGARRIYATATHAAHGQVQLSSGHRLHAPVLVLATGTALHLLPTAPQTDPHVKPEPLIRPRKGHLLITDRYPGLLHHQVVELGYLKSAHASTEDSVACNLQPRSTGQLLIGSSRQFGDDDPAVVPALLARMLARAVLYMPTLATLSSLRVWTGFRAATADKLPLIGPAAGLFQLTNQPGNQPDRQSSTQFGSDFALQPSNQPGNQPDPSLYLALGHEGLGITTSLATAQLLLDQILGRPSAIPIAPYLPSRLAPQPAAQPTSSPERAHA